MPRELSARRARAVCIRCHSHKVRCDIETHQEACSRCMDGGYECHPYIGIRKQRVFRSIQTSTPPTDSQLQFAANSTSNPSATSISGSSSTSPFDIISHSHSIRSRQSHVPSSSVGSGLPLLDIDQANLLPSPVIAQALADFYFNEFFHLVPVIDLDQAELQTSLLLRQCLCFAGSLMRQFTGSMEWSPYAIHRRIKSLLYHDRDPQNVITALSILSSWQPSEPGTILLDSPYQWCGMAVRLGLQMRWHDEETYPRLQHPGRARRIWWYLFVNDTLQMACSGLPGTFPIEKTSARLPTPADFTTQDTSSQVFCAMVSLFKIIRKTMELARVDYTSLEDLYSCLDDLRLWREDLPDELQLFHPNTFSRRSYSRIVVEAHIYYLVAIILTSFLGRRDRPSLFKFTSMSASSCIARLYEEIDCHEHIKYLATTHSWAILVAAVPGTFGDGELLNPERAEEQEIMQQVLEKMCEKHPSAIMVRNKLKTMGPSEKDFTAHSEAVWDPDFTVNERSISMRSMFHFPSSFCAMLGFLDSNKKQQENTVDFSPNWSIEWSSFLCDNNADLTFLEP